MIQPAEPIMEVTDVHRAFGKVKAVQGVTFSLKRGDVVGFIGANGAGKTTTMRMMATIEPPDSGIIRFCGSDVSSFPAEVRQRLGWMPDNYGAYENMTIADYLDFFARAYGLKGKARTKRIAEIMAFTDLAPIADRDIRKLSKGMGQRLCLGRTLLNDPDLLIMDEPAAGLDPKARIEFKNLVALLAEQGKTLFISSHILTELAQMCNSMLFIDGGKIVHHGDAASLQQVHESEAEYEVQVLSPVDAFQNWIAMNPGVTEVSVARNRVKIRLESQDETFAAAQLRKMIGDGIEIAQFQRIERRLEDAFVQMLKREGSQDLKA